MTFPGLRLKVPVALLTRGRNSVSLRLKRRSSGADRPVRVRRMELAVGYAPEKAATDARQGQAARTAQDQAPVRKIDSSIQPGLKWRGDQSTGI